MAQQTTTKVIREERVCWVAPVLSLNWWITVSSSGLVVGLGSFVQPGLISLFSVLQPMAWHTLPC